MDAATDQQAEIEAVSAIYGQDLEIIRTLGPWKDVLTELRIITRPQDDNLKSRVQVTLSLRLPKTYPKLPVEVTLINPLGLTKPVIAELQSELTNHSKSLKGAEAIFDLVSLASNFITENHGVIQQEKPSLLEQLGERETQARDAQAIRLQELETARSDAERAHKEEVVLQAEADKRARLEAIKSIPQAVRDDQAFGHAVVQTVTFQDVQVDTEHLSSVTVSKGPIISSVIGSAHLTELDLEDTAPKQDAILRIVDFSRQMAYFSSHVGRNKLQDLLGEINRVKACRQAGLSQIYAAHLSGARLLVLGESLAGWISLENLQQSGASFPVARIRSVLTAVAEALAALHQAGISHKRVNRTHVYLSQSRIKLADASYMQLLLDMNRSIPFEDVSERVISPAAWSCPEAVASPLAYSTARDVFELGLLAVHMIDPDAQASFSGPAHFLQIFDEDQALSSLIEDLLSPKEFRPSIGQALSRLAQKGFGRQQDLMGASSSRDRSLPSPQKAAADVLAPREKQRQLFWQPVPAEVTGSSRYRAEFEEVEFLGQGGFGRVVKAMNKLDRNMYAIKKVELPADPLMEHKILREVTTWSRLSHPSIVRYHTAWVETESESLDAKSVLDDIESSKAITSSVEVDSAAFQLHLDDTDFLSHRNQETSLPDVHFGNSDDETTSESDSDPSISRARTDPSLQMPSVNRIKPEKRLLYIQMEFLAGKTLREAIDDGLSEPETWKILLQILQAMKHFSSLSIVHRDLKPHNIFLELDKTVKVGDFGLAIEANGGNSDTNAKGRASPDVTSGVGTSLYAAPEVLNQSRRRYGSSDPLAPRVDCYSLGIVLFEMVYSFKTRMERYDTLTALRSSKITFPSDWQTQRNREREIVRQLLSHHPADRPLPDEVLAMIPDHLIDQTVDQTVKLLQRPRSVHKAKVLQALLDPPFQDLQINDILYDQDRKVITRPPDEAAIVRLEKLLESRGAVKIDLDAIMPYCGLYRPEEGRRAVKMLNEDGHVLQLTYDHTLPLCRQVARDPSLGRLKRYTISPVYRYDSNGPPRQPMAISFDIVSQQKTLAAEAESIQLVDDMLLAAGGRGKYQHTLGHSSIASFIAGDLPAADRQTLLRFLEVWTSVGDYDPTKLLMDVSKLPGLTRRCIDLLNALNVQIPAADFETDVAHLRKAYAPLALAFDDLQTVIQNLQAFDMEHPVIINLLMCVNPHLHQFGSSTMFVTTLGGRKRQTIAVGGRYDGLVAHFALPDRPSKTHMVGVSVAFSHISQLMQKQEDQVNRPFGHADRRCDVYIVSFVPGQEPERLRLAHLLWKNGIKADLMYEGDIQSPDQMLLRRREENILYYIVVKPSSSRNVIYKVRGIMKGTEDEVTRHDLVPWLKERIADQNRLEATTAQSASSAAKFSTRPIYMFAEEIHKDAFKRRETRQRGIIADKAIACVDAKSRLLNDDNPIFVLDLEPHSVAYVLNPSWIGHDENESYEKWKLSLHLQFWKLTLSSDEFGDACTTTNSQ